MGGDLDFRAAAEALLREERRATAKALHDGPAQSLTAATLRLQSALAFDEVTTEVVETAAGELETASRGVRATMARLSGGISPASVAGTLAALAEAAGLAVEAEADAELVESIDPVVALDLAAAAAAAAAGLARGGGGSVRIVVEPGDPVRATLTPDAGDPVVVTPP